MRFNAELEKPEHLRNERFVVSILEANYPRKFKKLPTVYSADFAIFSLCQVLTGVCEFKKRNFEYGRFDTHDISALKVQKCVTQADFWGVPFSIFFALNDGIYCYQWDSKDITNKDIKYGGRTKKTRINAPSDIELMYKIPSEYFKLVARYG